MELGNLINILPKDIDGAVITDENNRLYLTGFKSDAGVLILTRTGSIFLTDSRYLEAAQSTVDCCDVRELKALSEQLPEYLKKFNCSCVAIESDTVTISSLREYGRILKPEGLKLVFDGRLDKCLQYMRSSKSDEEVANIRAAQEIAESAFDYITSKIKVGDTERDIALALDFYMLRNGSEETAFDTIVISGKNTSRPHGVPSNKKVAFGDLVTIDFGATYNGYRSDMTRTFAVGEVSDQQSEVYSTVLEAQLAAIAAVKAEASCVEVDAAARNIIVAAGYGDNFGHGTGHGVGIEIHEHPNVSSKSKHILNSGNIITIEPGIYIPGEFGIRIEDMLLVTYEGSENLTSTPKELLVINN